MEMVSWFGIMKVFFFGLGCGMWGNGGTQSILEVENRCGVPVSALSFSVLLGWSFESKFYVLPQTR